MNVDALSENLEKFCQVLWTPDDLIEIRMLPSTRSYWHRAVDIPAQADWLIEASMKKENIYAGVLPRLMQGSKMNEECKDGWCIWADFDGVEHETVAGRIDTAGFLNPSMMIDSGHGIHCYWALTDKASPPALRTLVADVAVMLGSDPSVCNEGRIMRLPGFTNWKEPVAECSILYGRPEQRYDFSELRDITPSRLELPVRPSPGGPTKDPPDVLDLIFRATQYVDRIPGCGPGGRTRQAFKVAAFLVNDMTLPYSEALRILGNWDDKKNTPTISNDYPEGELEKILTNAKKYSKKPSGCKRDTVPPPRKEAHGAIGYPTGAEDSMSGLDRRFIAQSRGEQVSIDTPWRRLTKLARPLRPGGVTILAGPPGFGKTTFALQILIHLIQNQQSAVFLPLECEKDDIDNRVLAMLSKDWSVTDDDPQGANKRRMLLREYKDQLAPIGAGILDNPLIPRQVSKDAPEQVRPLRYTDALKWFRDGRSRFRVMILDPMAQISFGERMYAGQVDFARNLVQIARNHDTTFIIVAHTVKRPGKSSTFPLSGEDIQGAAELRRYADCVLMLDRYEGETSNIARAGFPPETVEHNKIVTVDKARFGSGTGLRMAYNMSDPWFEELGIIVAKK